MRLVEMSFCELFSQCVGETLLAGRDSKAAHVLVDGGEGGSIVLGNHKDASAGEAAVLL
jgi:hypothetical protein